MQDLNISIIQTSIFWESCDSNLRMFGDKLDKIQGDVDLVVLPEMFSTGFSMRSGELSERMDGKTVCWLLKKSAEKSVGIVGTVIIEENGRYYNRLILVKPNGDLYFYDKRHLFRHAGENRFYSSGKIRIIVNYNGWKICPFICYDLRFPIWIRNFDNEYDVALFLSNWPKSRSVIWKKLLSARAIENQSYVIGVNRVGKDGNGIEYNGDSSIIGPDGEVILCANSKEVIMKKKLSYEALDRLRYEFPVWKDFDSNLVNFREYRTTYYDCENGSKFEKS